VRNTEDSHLSAAYVPIVLAGYQWDFIWWIYRLDVDLGEVEKEALSFDMFLLEYVEGIFKEYVKRKKRM